MKLRLTSRIVLFFVLLVAVLLAVVGVLSYRSGSESLQAAAISEMLVAATEKEAALDTWIEERLTDIRQLSAFVDLGEKAANLIAAPPGSEQARSAHAILLAELGPRTTSPHSGFTELFVMEPESGKVMASTSPAEEGKSKRGHPYFDSGKTQFYVQAPYQSLDLKAPAMTAAIPLRATNGRVVAVLAARLDLAVLNTIAQRRTGLRQTEDSFLFNAEQFPVTQPRYINEPAVLGRKLDTEAIRRCAARNSGVALAPDYRGVPSIAVYRWNAKRQLGLIVKIDQAEALAPARAFGWSVILISSLALFATVGLAFLLARTITRPLRTLHEGVRRFAEGNLREQVPEYSRDEVGLLAREFNGMAAHIAKRTAEIARVNEALKAENAERKRAEEASCASQQLIEGILNAMPVRIFWKDENLVYLGCNAALARDAGFAEPKDVIGKDDYLMGWRDQAELYRRDDRQVIESGCAKLLIEEPLTTPEGNNITLLTSKLPLRGSTGQISGVLGMYMDITERKQSEEVLRQQVKLQDQLVRTAASVPGMIYSLLMRPDGSTRMPYASGALSEIFDLQPKDVFDDAARVFSMIHLGDIGHVMATIAESARTLNPWRDDFRVRHTRLGEIWVEGHSVPQREPDGSILWHGFIQNITERKQVEERLQQSERRMRAITDSAQDAILMMDPQGWISYWNPAAERILGYTSAEAIGQNLHDLIVPSRFHAAHHRAFPVFRETGQGAAMGKLLDLEACRKDGQEISVQLSLSAVQMSDGWHAVGLLRDITARKQAEEALRQSEGRFRILFEQAADILLLLEITPESIPVIRDANNATFRLLGYERNELIGQPVSSIEAGPDASKEVERRRRNILSGMGGVFETSHRCKDGTIRDFECSVTQMQIGSKTFGISVERDITARKQAEEALRRSETKFRTLYDSTSDAVILLDQKGFFDCNQATLAMFGCATREEFCLKHPADVSPSAQPDGTDSLTLAKQHIATAMEKGSHHFEWMHKRADTGETFPAEVLLNALELDGKRVLQTVVRDITERKRSEQSLRLQSAALEAAANAIVITDHNGTIQLVNPAFTALTGYTAQEAIGQNPRILKSGKQDEAFYRKLWQTISSGQVWNGELTNRRKDGSVYAEEMTITPLRNADGVIARYVAIKQDITERKQAAEALHASQQIIEGILNAMPVRIFWKDKNLVYLGCNAALARDAGFAAPKDIIGKDDYQMGWSDRAELYRRDDRQVIESGCPKLLIEEPLTTPGDNTITLLTSKLPLRGGNGEVSGVLGMYMDITERKRSEAASIRLAAIVESSDDAIIGKDLNSLITSWNKGAEKLLGYTASEMIGTSITRLLPADRQDEENQILGKIIRGERPEHFETVRQDKDGRLIEVSVTASPIKDATGKVIGMSKVARDITERRRAQAELENLQRQLVDASREAGMAEIATSVLHNVGNVLNSINVSTGLVAESVKKSRASSLGRVVVLLQEHAHDLGAFITQDSRGKHVPAHLAQLAEHLQAEQETNVRELELLRHNVDHIKEIVAMQQTYASFGGVKEMINVVNLVEDSLRINEGAFSRHEVEVVREFKDVPPLNAEKHKILQILVNLLRNAKYACHDSERADKRLTVRVANGEGRVRISVIDNGVGIPLENLTRIFNHGFTTRKGGHGFGLHSGALAAKEMGGSLTVRSDGPGQGAEFTLELPVAQECRTELNAR